MRERGKEKEGTGAGTNTVPENCESVTYPTIYMVGIKEVARERHKRVRLFLSIYTIIIDSPLKTVQEILS